jgi:predicted TIM-barrel fold metal-dependent hydrolase
MILDGLALIGDSINGYRLAADDLLRSMDASGIDRCVIAPVLPEDLRLEPRNDRIAATRAEHPDRLSGFCRVDPRGGAKAVAELRRCARDLGLKGLLLHPMEEGYRINAPRSVRLLREAGSLGLPVTVAAGYPWVSHALQVCSAARQAPDTTIVMSHGGHINISGLAQPDAFLALGSCTNLYVGTNGVYRQDFLEECVASFGPGRVVFLSMVPVFDQGFELDRVRSIKMDDERRALILGENMRGLLCGP